MEKLTKLEKTHGIVFYETRIVLLDNGSEYIEKTRHLVMKNSGLLELWCVSGCIDQPFPSYSCKESGGIEPSKKISCYRQRCMCCKVNYYYMLSMCGYHWSLNSYNKKKDIIKYLSVVVKDTKIINIYIAKHILYYLYINYREVIALFEKDLYIL